VTGAAGKPKLHAITLPRLEQCMPKWYPEESFDLQGHFKYTSADLDTINIKGRFSHMDIAYAFGQAGGTAASGSNGGLLATPLVPIILMLGVMWFFLIRPQQKKQKEHREMLGSLKKGDRIITSGGLYGRITGITDATLTLEIADKVRVKVSRAHVAGLAKAVSQAAADSSAKDKSEADKK
jgi:preprotein translocase subunit YajC